MIFLTTNISHLLPWSPNPVTWLYKWLYKPMWLYTRGYIHAWLYKCGYMSCFVSPLPNNHIQPTLQGQPLILCDKETELEEELLKRSIRVPCTVDALQGLVTIIPLQLLSMHIAELKELDVSMWL